MDLPPAWSQTCICGWTFLALQAYTCHTRSCPKTKKWLFSALEKAKEIFQVKKCQKIEDAAWREATETAGPLVAEPSLNLPSDQQVSFLIWLFQDLYLFRYLHQTNETPMDYEDLDQPVAEWRTHHLNHQLPKRYRDIEPEPLASLPPPSSQSEYSKMGPGISRSPVQQPSMQVHASPVRKILKSVHNASGLYQQYYATHFPDHDPAENITSNDLTDTSSTLSSNPLAHNYYPYPNQSSFLLGEWYWNNGEKKSQSSFQNLLKIVSHPDFHPEDVAGKSWQAVNAQLSGEHSSYNHIWIVKY